jgi:hypothetical protein
MWRCTDFAPLKHYDISRRLCAPPIPEVFDAIAQARMHRAMIGAQLYLNRCKHASKNDDDLPVLR